LPVFTCGVWYDICFGGYVCRLLLGYIFTCMYAMMILEGSRKTLSTDRPFLLAHRPQPFITVMNSTAAHRLFNHNFSRTRPSIAFSPPRIYIYSFSRVSLVTYVRVVERVQGSNLSVWAYIYIYMCVLYTHYRHRCYYHRHYYSHPFCVRRVSYIIIYSLFPVTAATVFRWACNQSLWCGTL